MKLFICMTNCDHTKMYCTSLPFLDCPCESVVCFGCLYIISFPFAVCTSKLFLFSFALFGLIPFSFLRHWLTSSKQLCRWFLWPLDVSFIVIHVLFYTCLQATVSPINVWSSWSDEFVVESLDRVMFVWLCYFLVVVFYLFILVLFFLRGALDSALEQQFDILSVTFCLLTIIKDAYCQLLYWSVYMLRVKLLKIIEHLVVMIRTEVEQKIYDKKWDKNIHVCRF